MIIKNNPDLSCLEIITDLWQYKLHKNDLYLEELQKGAFPLFLCNLKKEHQTSKTFCDCPQD